MTGDSYFDSLYAASADPWHLAERAYEHRKFALTVASLPRQRYRRGFEPGCSIGMLTALLADRCEELVASDPVASPLRAAADRVAAPHVRFEQGGIPRDWPDDTFDLVVLSELLYYLTADDRREVLRRSEECLDAHGHIVLVHWRHPFEVAQCTGEQAHEEVRRRPGLTRLVRHEEDDFLLEVFGHA